MIASKYYTICIRVTDPYYLQFLPIVNHESELLEEVREIAHFTGGILISASAETMKYCLEDRLVPRNAEYCCAVFSASCNLARIRPRGSHYSHVFGVTASLSEHFFLRRKVYGPSWIRVTGAEKRQKVSTVSMFSIPTINCVSPLPHSHPAPMNIGAMAVRALFRSHEIFMVSLRLFREWDIENFTGNGTKSLTLVCSTSLAPVAPGVESTQSLQICRTEQELLERFAKIVNDYDIDILASYGLASFDIPLIFDRMRAKRVENWWKIGRLRRTAPPKQGRLNIQMSLSGRVPCDLRACCMEHMRAKSNDLSAAVQLQFGFNRQMIDHFEVGTAITKPDELANLVNYNVRDTLFIAQLLNALKVLPLSMQISQPTGCPWARVILGLANPRCKSILLRYFLDAGFVLPEMIRFYSQSARFIRLVLSRLIIFHIIL
jgi:DNA polymerase alpha subunit A